MELVPAESQGEKIPFLKVSDASQDSPARCTKYANCYAPELSQPASGGGAVLQPASGRGRLTWGLGRTHAHVSRWFFLLHHPSPAPQLGHKPLTPFQLISSLLPTASSIAIYLASYTRNFSLASSSDALSCSSSSSPHAATAPAPFPPHSLQQRSLFSPTRSLQNHVVYPGKGSGLPEQPRPGGMLPIPLQKLSSHLGANRSAAVQVPCPR